MVARLFQSLPAAVCVASVLLACSAAAEPSAPPKRIASRYETHRYRAPQLFMKEWASARTTSKQRRFFETYDALRSKQAAGEVTHRERVTNSLRSAGFKIPAPGWADISPFDSHLWITAPAATLVDIEQRLRIHPVLPHPKPLL